MAVLKRNAPGRRTRRGWRRLRDESGQALVELALVMPIFALLLFGLMEMARAWNVHQVLTLAAREGARTAVLASASLTEDSVRTVIANSLQVAALDPALSQVSISGMKSGTGKPVVVQIQYPFSFLFLGEKAGVVSPKITLTSAAVMRSE